VLRAVLFLVLGMVIGSAGTVVVLVKRVQYSLRHPEVRSARAAARLQRRFKLTEEQRRRVEAIVRAHVARLQELRAEVWPRLEGELDQLRDDVAGVLTPEQAQAWREGFEKRRSAWLPSPPPAASTRPAPGPTTAPVR